MLISGKEDAANNCRHFPDFRQVKMKEDFLTAYI
jgi:hypothetical protein